MNFITIARRIAFNRKVIQSVNHSLRFPSVQWRCQVSLDLLKNRYLSVVPTTREVPSRNSVEEIDLSISSENAQKLTNLSDVLSKLKSLREMDGKRHGELDSVLRETMKKETSLKATDEEMLEVMRLLAARRIYAHKNKGVTALIRKVLGIMREQGNTVEDKVKMEVLSLCGKLEYQCTDLNSSDCSEMREVIEGIDIGYVSESLARYGDYFFTLAGVQLVWKDLSEERRRQVLSCMSRFGEVGKEGLLGAGRLVYGVDNMLILKDHLREMREEEKRWYERFLNIVLEEKYGSHKSMTSKNNDRGRGVMISYALLSQLKALAADRGQRQLSEHQMELLYRGLREEWQGIPLYQQCLTLLTLGELSIHYKSVPEDLWKIMMKDLVKKMSKGIKARKLSELLKGWKGMKVRWSELDEELKEAVMRAVASINEGRVLVNAILYMGDLGVVWKEDVSEENEMRILSGIEKACGEFNGQGVSNTLLGLCKMRVSWEMMNEGVGSKLMSVIERKSEEMNEQGLSNTIHSLAKMKVSWKMLSGEMKNVFCKAIELRHKSMSEQGISNTIYSLGKMGVVANDLPRSLKEILEGSVRRVSRMKYPPQGTSNIMYGLSKMGYTWQSLGEETQAALVEMILRSSKEFNAQNVSNTMYSVRGMMKDDNAISEKEYFIAVNKALLLRYEELLGKKVMFTSKDRSQMELYVSWLEVLPGKVLKTLLKSVKRELK